MIFEKILSVWYGFVFSNTVSSARLGFFSEENLRDIFCAVTFLQDGIFLNGFTYNVSVP